MLKGIDVSNWQSGLNLKPLKLDFVICKLSEGLTFKDPTAAEFIRQARACNMLTGLYHFASNADPETQATRFYELMKPYHGESIPVLDLEVSSVKNWGLFAEYFVKRYRKLCGVTPMIYTSAGFLHTYKNNPYVYENCTLWLAGYPRRAYWWNDGKLPYSTSPWSKAALWQFTGTGSLEGYGGNLDLDWCYISRDEWKAIAKGKSTTPAKQTTKTLDQIAKEVIAGKWDIGQERKKKLEAAGYNYAAVQKRVNELLKQQKAKDEYTIAKEVIAGKWGAGNDRKHRLELAGYNYERVQKIVNELLKKY